MLGGAGGIGGTGIFGNPIWILSSASFNRTKELGCMSSCRAMSSILNGNPLTLGNATDVSNIGNNGVEPFTSIDKVVLVNKESTYVSCHVLLFDGSRNLSAVSSQFLSGLNQKKFSNPIWGPALGGKGTTELSIFSESEPPLPPSFPDFNRDTRPTQQEREP
jgi:hypothetical protein